MEPSGGGTRRDEKDPLTNPKPEITSLHVGIEYGLGGEARIVSELMRSLPAAGVGFHGLVAAPDNAATLTDGRIHSFAPEGSSMPARLAGARRAIRRAIREQKPEIVASHFAIYTAPALDLLRIARNVSHFHGPWSAEALAEGQSRFAGGAKALIEGIVYRRADRVIVLSRAFEELLVRSFRVAKDRVRLVPGCVDAGRFAVPATPAESRKLLGLPGDRPILVSVRRLVRRMGLHTLVEAMPEIVAKVPDVLLCIAGRGPMLAELTAMVEQRGLQNHVRFLGFVADEMLPHLYRAADLSVVPTRALEGFGLVAAESIAAGTPALVTPIGGLPEVVSGLSPNLIFASPEALDLAEGTVQALLGRVAMPSDIACRAYVQANFTSALMAERTAAVYRELL